MLGIAAVILGAAVLGMVANRLLRPHLESYHNTHRVDMGKADSWASGVLGPSVTLLALFLAFVLAGASESYSQAKTAAQNEASVVDGFFETAGYLDDPSRQRLQRAALCYARSVAGPEWEAMRTGDASSVPAHWTGSGPDGMRREFRALGPGNSLFSTLTSADQRRDDARRSRLAESNPTISDAVLAFLLAVAAAVVLYHAVTSPPRSILHIVATVFAAATLLAGLAAIHTLDRPFSGATRIDPTQMRITADDIAEDYVERYGPARVGCDANGNPVRSS